MKLWKLLVLTLLLVYSCNINLAQGTRLRDYGVKIGRLETGRFNSITDVEGVNVGQTTVIEENNVRTGVTAILPHSENIFQNKVPAAMYIANGFGKMTGYSQVVELGNIETPIVLTNTLSVPTAADALIDYVFSFDENNYVRSVNPIVGETNDGGLNDIRGRHVTKEHVLSAIHNASSGHVNEGSVGAGTGTICFGYKGGIGTSSRVLHEIDGGFTVGVLVQTNFGGDLTIAGVPVQRILNEEKDDNGGDGSVMMIVTTDAPLTSRNLKRLAKRATFGIARTGGNCSNGSGEYVIAFSTAKELRIPYERNGKFFVSGKELRNDRMTPLFEAVIEATEEAVINSLFAAVTVTGKNNRTVEALPVAKVIQILKEHHVGIE